MGKIPGTFNGNGPQPEVPPDLPYPCTIVSCSGDLEHTTECDGTCETWEPTENQVKLQNLEREFRRHGFEASGVGTNADLTELFLRINALEDIALELYGIDHEEYDELYRGKKIEFLERFLENHLEQLKKARTASALGIIEKKPIIGPDGRPIG